MNGILMTSENHKATRELRKYQTRRLDHLKEINKEPDAWWLDEPNSRDGHFIFIHRAKETAPYLKEIEVKPRYQIGEVVYLKEVWRTGKGLDNLPPRLSGINSPFQYKLDMHSIRGNSITKYSSWGKWRSPMFMPAWAARDFITITDVNLGRLQDITEEDAKAEGIEPIYKTTKAGYIWTPHGYRDGFINLWDSINPKYPWASNPWNFKYSFQLKGGE